MHKMLKTKTNIGNKMKTVRDNKVISISLITTFGGFHFVTYNQIKML
jgi:hypothetical protein